MDIINQVFGEIKPQIIQTIKVSNTPFDAARHIAVAWQLRPTTAQLLLKGIESIFNTYHN